MPLRQGDTVGPYVVLEKLGEGGMGEVYKARDNRLGRMVALKCLPADRVADATRRQRFLQEAQAASALNHPGIITIHDWLEERGESILVMEFVRGKPLDQLIPRKGLPLKDALRYASQVADALAAAHAVGIIHRDIKPANVMVTEEGRIKILDFGLAKLEEREITDDDNLAATRKAQAVSEPGTVAGSAPYMSPEQAEGKKLDARSDIFSFGALLYELITGQRAFHGDTGASTMAAILKTDPKPAAQLVEGLPKELDRIITRCLRKDLDRRSHSIAEIKLALDEIREESESGLQPAAAAPSRKPRSWMPFAAVGIALLFAGGIWLASRSSQPNIPSYRVRQLTRGDDSSFSAAMSPDGKFVVYVSLRGGRRDLWLQQIGGGEAVRLTDTPQPETWPMFSPDGTQILFRTPEALSVISALGGAEHQLVTGTVNLSYWTAAFSPDGKWIAYKMGSEFSGGATIMLIAVTGGTPRELIHLQDNIIGAVWSPDSARLLFATSASSRNLWYGPFVWRTISISNGNVSKVDGMAHLTAAGLSEAAPISWLATGNRVIVGSWEESNHIWQVPMTSTGNIAGPPVRLTNGTGESPGYPSLDGRTIPFTNGSRGTAIYSLPLDVAQAKAKGQPEKVTRGEGLSSFAVVSQDGAKLLYISDRLGNPDLWLRDNQTGEEKVLLASKERETRGFLSPDGSKLSFQRIENDNPTSYWMPASGGPQTKICDNCRSLLSWTPDSQGVIISSPEKPESMLIHNIQTGKRTVIVRHPKFDIHDVAFSPDGKWFTAKLFQTAKDAPILVAPFRPDGPVPESEWIWITREGNPSKALWTPDGSMLYYLFSGRLEARRLDPASKRPLGEPIVVYKLENNRRVPSGVFIGYGLAPDRFYLPVSQGNAQVWLAEAEDPR